MPLNLEVLTVVLQSVIDSLKDLAYLGKTFGKESIIKVNLDKFGKKTIEWENGKAGLNQDFDVVLWNVMYENMQMKKEDISGNVKELEFEVSVAEAMEECLEWVRMKEESGWNGVEKGTWEMMKSEYGEWVKDLEKEREEKEDKKDKEEK